jgi:hypothetical protein
LFGILERKISFNEFVRRIQLIPERQLDQHIKPQSLLLKPYAKLKPTVLKLEHREIVNSFFLESNLELPKLNTSVSYDYKTYYDEQSFRIAGMIYATDEKLFEYEEQKEELKLFIEKSNAHVKPV